MSSTCRSCFRPNPAFERTRRQAPFFAQVEAADRSARTLGRDVGGVVGGGRGPTAYGHTRVAIARHAFHSLGMLLLICRVALRDIPVLTVALGRTGIAAALLLLVLAATRSPLLPCYSAGGAHFLGALRAANSTKSLIVRAQTRTTKRCRRNPQFDIAPVHDGHRTRTDHRRSVDPAEGDWMPDWHGGCHRDDRVWTLYQNSEMESPGSLQMPRHAAMASPPFMAGGLTPNTGSAAGMLCGATLLILPVALVVDHPGH